MRLLAPLLRLLVSLALLSFVGVACNLPERIRTILPPTNERDLCLWDNRFYYSKVYDFCIRYPNDDWKQVKNTGSRAVLNSPFTANTFSYVEDGVPKVVFVLYVTGYGQKNRERMQKEGITIAYDADPYLIGYVIPPDQDKLVEAFAKQVPKMLENIQIFAKPQGRK